MTVSLPGYNRRFESGGKGILLDIDGSPGGQAAGAFDCAGHDLPDARTGSVWALAK